MRAVAAGKQLLVLIRAPRSRYFDPETCPDPIFLASDLAGVYNDCSPGGSYRGRCTAPLLVDTDERRIISNDSGAIIRMLNYLAPSMDCGTGEALDLFPEELRPEILEAGDWIYEQVNNGCYRCGFATRQAAYARAEEALHAALADIDRSLDVTNRPTSCEHGLRPGPFLCGEVVTEADVRLLPTICRFDAIYSGIFRCGRRRIQSDYNNIHAWLHRMLDLRGRGTKPLRSTLDLDAARVSYYRNLFPLNPSGIVPAGPTAAELGLEPAS